jgi:hypothetical protein
MTLLKMRNGLIKPDRGTITMRGRVGALIALGAGFNPILTGREPKGWEASRTSNRRLAQRVQRQRGGATKYFPERSNPGDAEGRTETMGGVEIGYRRQAPRALRFGKNANQIARKFDEILEFSRCAPSHRSSDG